MMKAGIYEEMLEDTMDVLETEEEEEDAQAEIDKILNELTAGALGAAPDALKGEEGFSISNLHIHRLYCHSCFSYVRITNLWQIFSPYRHMKLIELNFY